jgi:hypothetical protein
MKKRLLTNWNIMRWLRLFIGIYVGIEAIRTGEYIFGFLSVLLLLQALSDTGCCCMNHCSVPLSKDKKEG